LAAEKRVANPTYNYEEKGSITEKLQLNQNQL
jgi:hypothetical protein